MRPSRAKGAENGRTPESLPRGMSGNLPSPECFSVAGAGADGETAAPSRRRSGTRPGRTPLSSLGADDGPGVVPLPRSRAARLLPPLTALLWLLFCAGVPPEGGPRVAAPEIPAPAGATDRAPEAARPVSPATPAATSSNPVLPSSSPATSDAATSSEPSGPTVPSSGADADRKAPTPAAFAALLGDGRPTVRTEPLKHSPDEAALPEFLFDYPVERYVVEYANGYAFSSLLIKNSGRNLLIYNHGHDPTFGESFSREFLQRYLRSGGSLLLTWMPLRDPRFPPQAPLRVKLWNTAERVEIRTDRHEALALFDTGGYHFFRYFLDPILLPLQDVAGKYETISYVGLSGGGWTGLILAALDPPVDRYVLAAGFLPEEGRTTKKDLGDMEQITPSVYRRFPYRFFLERLNAKGPSASWVIYNTEDDCCYRAADHAELIRKMEQDYPNIRFEIRESKTHSYSPDRVLELVAPGAPGLSWWERLF